MAAYRRAREFRRAFSNSSPVLRFPGADIPVTGLAPALR